MKINVTGCSLVDNLYSPVDFNSTGYKKWTAESGIENGLITGGLIFGDDLEESSGVLYAELLKEITGGTVLPEKNVGGPAVVAVIHMSQILDTGRHVLGFYGCRGKDANGVFIDEKLRQFDIDISGYMTAEGRTPFTDVLSDPSFNDNNGERTFINYIGAAGMITGRDLPESFFDADMLIFGGTGLTPGLHDDMSWLLKKAEKKGSLTCINTVYDFRNQKKDPLNPWPLVSEPGDFGLIDLLIADNEEAIRISGQKDKLGAADFFASAGVHSVIITHGADPIVCWSDGTLFREEGHFTMPVSAQAGQAMKEAPAHTADTTGCGDNFAGGVYASLAAQAQTGRPSLKEAAALGAVSGGFAGLYRGGVYFEKRSGEKLERIKALLEAYGKQEGVFDE